MEGVRTSRSGKTSWLTLDNPPGNGLYPGLLESLTQALKDADADPDVNSVVITGAGEKFCVGVDGERLRGGDPTSFASKLVALFKLVPTLGVPVLAAVNGDALMSGFSLVCATDIAIAVEDAKLGTLEASLGLWPTIAQVPVLHSLLPKHALANVLTGVPFDAKRAYEIGAVTAVTSADQLEAEVQRWIELSTRSEVLARGRRSAHKLLSLPYADALDASYEEFAALFSTRKPT